uniref:Uncharacterized protein n=1 Tax=Peromyscus maniculatus bairdii TaxID=230844 RepID=A0A8C8TU18_PERMB
MLLLLTLALLAGATCRAQNVLDNNIGTYFYIVDEGKGEIKSIRIFYTAARRLNGIQLQFQNHWSDVHGIRSKYYEEFLLNDGEHVIKVLGRIVSLLSKESNFYQAKLRNSPTPELVSS